MISLLIRDLRLALRAGGGFGLALVFYLIIVTLFPLALGPDKTLLIAIAPGVLLIGALLSCLLSVDRIFMNDFEDGSFDLLATAPFPLEGIYLTKALSHWLTTGLPLALIAPLWGVMLGLSPYANGLLVLSLVLCTPALSLIGAFGGALTLTIKRGGLLLAILVLPLYMPSLIVAANALRRAIEGQSAQTPLMVLAAITFGCAAILPFASAAVLRVNLR